MKWQRQHIVPVLTREERMASAILAPAILSLVWANGALVELPSTTMVACEAAVRAVDAGRWSLPGRSLPAHASCRLGDAFQPGWQCIKGSKPLICG